MEKFAKISHALCTIFKMIKCITDNLISNCSYLEQLKSYRTSHMRYDALYPLKGSKATNVYDVNKLSVFHG